MRTAIRSRGRKVKRAARVRLVSRLVRADEYRSHSVTALGMLPILEHQARRLPDPEPYQGDEHVAAWVRVRVPA